MMGWHQTTSLPVERPPSKIARTQRKCGPGMERVFEREDRGAWMNKPVFIGFSLFIGLSAFTDFIQVQAGLFVLEEKEKALACALRKKATL